MFSLAAVPAGRQCQRLTDTPVERQAWQSFQCFFGSRVRGCLCRAHRRGRRRRPHHSRHGANDTARLCRRLGRADAQGPRSRRSQRAPKIGLRRQTRRAAGDAQATCRPRPGERSCDGARLPPGAAFDRAAADPTEAAYTSLLTPAIKFHVCKSVPGFVYEALESLGGNGYVEDLPMAQLYREAPLNAIWEGAGNVLALDDLRATGRMGETAVALIEALATATGKAAQPLADAVLSGLRSNDPEAQARARLRSCPARLARRSARGRFPSGRGLCCDAGFHGRTPAVRRLRSRRLRTGVARPRFRRLSRAPART